jgi:hypothetical protein
VLPLLAADPALFFGAEARGHLKEDGAYMNRRRDSQ